MRFSDRGVRGHFIEMGEKARQGELVREDLVRLRRELSEMERRGTLPAALHDVHRSIEELASRPVVASEAPPAAQAAQGQAETQGGRG